MGTGKLLSNGTSLSSHISEFLQSVPINSRRTTEQRLKWFEVFMMREVDGDLSKVTLRTAEGYVQYLLTERKLQRTSARCYLSAARKFWRKRWIDDKATSVLFDMLDKLRARRTFKPDPLTPEEMDHFLAQEHDAAWRALFEVYAATGARCVEILHLRHGDLDLKRGKLHCTVKGGEELPIHIDERGIKFLKAYIGEGPHDPDAPVWPGRGPGGHPSKKASGKFLSKQAVCNHVHKVAALAGLAPGRMRTHLFRHSFATELLRETQNLEAVRKALRHKDISTTQYYVDASEAEVHDMVEQRGRKRMAAISA